MFCRNCGTQLNDNQAFCQNCGAPQNTQTAQAAPAAQGYPLCPNCGNPVMPGAAVCQTCGAPLMPPVQQPMQPMQQNGAYLNGQDKTVMALICFFLGGIGIHNFMMGETKKGVMKIVFAFLCGISGIFALIDFIKILMGSYKVDPNALI